MAQSAKSMRLRPRLALFLSAAMLASARPPGPLPPPTVERAIADFAATPMGTTAAPCLISTNVFKTGPVGYRYPVTLYNLDSSTGAGSLPRATSAPTLIGLAWGRDNRLYGVSTFGVPAGYQPDSVYRIDPASGSTTLIGPTGLKMLGEGGLATNPLTGEIYGAGSEWLFRLSGLTATASVPTAEKIGRIVYPSVQNPWDLSGLAFDSAGQLYGLAHPWVATGPSAHLIRLDLANIANGVIPVDLDITLPGRFHQVGGLDFVGGRLFYADGNMPGLSQGGTANNLYDLYEINPTTGAVISKGSTNIVGGVSSLVSCAPEKPFCTPPPPDLDAWYPMDGAPIDLVLGKNAVPSSAIGYPNGIAARAALLNGTYLTVPDGPVLDQGLGDFSIDVWIVRITDQQGVRPIIDKRVASGSSVRGWSLFLYDGRPALQLADGTAANYIDSGPPLAPGWRHIAVTVDRDNPQGITFYVDGVPRAPLNPTARQGNLDNSAPTSINRHSLNGTVPGLLLIDELEFFDRSLGAAEIRAIVDARAAGKCKADFQ